MLAFCFSLYDPYFLNQRLSSHGSKALVGLSLVYEVPQSQWVRHTTLGKLLWKSDCLVAETSTWQHKTHQILTFMPLSGFKPVTPARERPLTLTTDRATTGIGLNQWTLIAILWVSAQSFDVRGGSAYLKREGAPKVHVIQKRSCNFRFCYFPPPPCCVFWTSVSKPVSWIK